MHLALDRRPYPQIHPQKAAGFQRSRADRGKQVRFEHFDKSK